MIIAQALLSMAYHRIAQIETDNELVNSLLLELEIAASLAITFNQTINSIYWNKSSKRTKTRVKKKLIKIAQMIFDNIRESIDLFNALCDEQEKIETISFSKEWIEISQGLQEVQKLFMEYHYPLIEPLPLFKDNDLFKDLY